jgi:dynein heavy chain
MFISSQKVSEKLKLGAKTAIDIEKLRDGYRPAAKRGAILFFVLADMSLVNTMYQYSLSSYLEVFQLSLKKSMPDSILQKRLRNIMDTLTHNIYNYGCTGEGVFTLLFNQVPTSPECALVARIL